MKSFSFSTIRLDWFLLILLLPISTFGHFNSTYDGVTVILAGMVTVAISIASVIMFVQAVQDYRRGRFGRGVAMTLGHIQSILLLALIAALLSNIGWTTLAFLLFGFGMFNFILSRIRYLALRS